MARKRYKPEEIVAKLRQVDVLVSPRPVNDGRDPPDRRELSNLLSVAPRVRRAPDRASEADEGDQLENSRLRKAVSDLTLDKLIIQEAARGNF
jgi:putative transposase